MMPSRQVTRYTESKMTKNLFQFADKELLINLIFTLQSELSAALKLLQTKKLEYVNINNKLMRISEQLTNGENSSESEIDQDIVSENLKILFFFFLFHFCVYSMCMFTVYKKIQTITVP